jgi:hypothetical protein
VIAYLVLRIALLIVMILAIRRIWGASALHGLLSLFVPGYIFVPVVKYWNDPDHDVRWHVLFLLVGGLVAFWWGLRLVHEYQADVTRAQEFQQQLAEQGDDEDGAADDADGTAAPLADDTKDAAATLATVRQTHPLLVATKSASPTAPVSTAQLPSRPAPQAVAPTADTKPESPLTFARAQAQATVFRGQYERPSMGLTLSLPDHFRALSSVDARRIETTLHQPTDDREIAWVLHEEVPLSGAASWHMRVRWIDDGWVDASVPRDAEHLLRTAQQAAKGTAHLAGSGGDLLGFAVAPSFAANTAAWVEERLPDGASVSVLDCHALRLGRKGVLEFSVVGAPAGSQALCHASVRLLARRARIDNGAEYPQHAPSEAAAAPYTLEDLVTQRR